MRLPRSPAVTLATLLACSGAGPEPGPGPGDLVVGTWGGKDAGLIATDTGAHLHIGCTLSSVAGSITLDAGGRFDVPALTTSPPIRWTWASCIPLAAHPPGLRGRVARALVRRAPATP